MNDRNNRVAVRSFADAFAGALSASIAQAIGSPWRLQVVADQEPLTRNEEPLQFRVEVQGGLRGDCFVEFYEPQLSELLSKLPGEDSQEASAVDRGQALAALLYTATENLKSSLSTQYGDLTFKVECVSGLAFGGIFVVPLAGPGDDSSYSVLLYFDGGLLEALSSVAAGQEQFDPAKGKFLPANLRLVMDVELNVSLRFGQRKLPLREVLELTSGSVIELDRMVDDPVELLLDGKVVARGEAVIVDGNYGLRVTEIPQAIETHLLG